MKVYLAGKITGDPGYRAKFRAARERVEWMGHIALDPSVLPEGMETADYMRICTAMLDSADAIGLLRDWPDLCRGGGPERQCDPGLLLHLGSAEHPPARGRYPDRVRGGMRWTRRSTSWCGSEPDRWSR